ncbi:hypothetical protein PQQ63_07355 [Paraburkholderia metrosideri]|uniref:Transmembrane protein n=1 Tax=Paraburkholderia metrosideri TaxID=580937 RepID=A0ABW9DME1_9BURK
MNLAFAFSFQLLVPILVGLFVMRYLRTVLWRMLTDLCGTFERAEFWVRVSAVLMAAAPLLFVLATSANPLACSTSELVCVIGLLRRTCIYTLVGVLAAVGTVATIVRRYIPQEANEPRAASIVERSV